MIRNKKKKSKNKNNDWRTFSLAPLTGLNIWLFIYGHGLITAVNVNVNNFSILFRRLFVSLEPFILNQHLDARYGPVYHFIAQRLNAITFIAWATKAATNKIYTYLICPFR